MANLSSCPDLNIYVGKEIERIQRSISRIVQGLDPSSALSILKEAVTDDLTTNAARFSKAAAEGIGSEFTQKLIKGVLDQVLDEVISQLPPGQGREVVTKLRSMTDISFSMIQLAIALSDKSPLVMASKAKKALYDTFSLREDLANAVISKLEQLRIILSSVENANSTDETIAQKVNKSITNAFSKISDADRKLLSVQESLLRKLVDIDNLDGAKSDILSAIQALSPVDKSFNASAITTNEEIIDLLNANVSDSAISEQILRASGKNNFAFETEDLEDLKENGMSTSLQEIFLSVRDVPKISDPAQIIWKKVKDITLQINQDVQLLEQYESAIPRILNNYISIREALEKPKAQEIHSNEMYGRIINSVRSRLSSVMAQMTVTQTFLEANKRPTSDSFSTSSVGDWIGQLSASLSVLDIVRQGFYEEKKINANPLTSKFYEAYEKSIFSLRVSQFKWTDPVKAKEHLNFSSGIDLINSSVGTGHAILSSSSHEDAKNLLVTLDINISTLKLFQEGLVAREVDCRTHIDKYSPEPGVPDIFNKLFAMLKQLGFDRIYDQLIEGGITGVLDMPPELGSYIGAAADCLRKKAQAANNEFERRKFERASLDLDKKNRARFIGKVNMSMRSAHAVKKLQERLSEIMALIKNLFDQDFLTTFNTATDGVFTELPTL